MAKPPSRLVRPVAVLFMVGAGCFAAAAFPGISALIPSELLAVTFFVGSLFFTSAAWLQYQQSSGARASEPTTSVGAASRVPLLWERGRTDRLAGLVQLAGTLWFNVNTFDAMFAGQTAQHENLRVWTPDIVGSVCFLVASGLALREVRYLRHAQQKSRDRTIAVVNEVGSVLFMLAAIAAFVRPDTSDPVAAYLANGGTFLGALCFFWGARLLLPARTAPQARNSG
jgi:hypothetical protein